MYYNIPIKPNIVMDEQFSLIVKNSPQSLIHCMQIIYTGSSRADKRDNIYILNNHTIALVDHADHSLESLSKLVHVLEREAVANMDVVEYSQEYLIDSNISIIQKIDNVGIFDIRSNRYDEEDIYIINRHCSFNLRS